MSRILRAAAVLSSVLALVGLATGVTSVRAFTVINISHLMPLATPHFNQMVWGAIFRDAPYRQTHAIEKAANKHLAIIEIGQPFDRPVDRTALDLIHGNGSTPMVTWYPWSYHHLARERRSPGLYSLRALANGWLDDTLRREARGLRAFKYPVILRFAPEMNGDWYPWSESASGRPNSPGSFVRAWRHVHDVFDLAGATNIIWNWSPNVHYYSQPFQFSEYYPGDRYVDLIGVDGYNWGLVKPNYGGWRTPAHVFGSTLDVLRGLSRRPFIVSEVASAGPDRRRAQWIHAMFGYMHARGDVAALVYFNLKKETNWRFDSSPATLLAFRQELRYNVSGNPWTLLVRLTKKGTPQ